MTQEFFVAIVIFGGLAATGIPLWLLALRVMGAREDAASAMFAGPAAGLALVTLVSFPLYRYVGPTDEWKYPFAIAFVLLAIGATILLARGWSSNPTSARAIQIKDLAVGAAALCVVSAFYLVFAASGGEARLLYGSNPSDALSYLSAAEFTKTIPWDEINRASKSVLPGPDQIAVLRDSPMALFSARYLGFSIRLDTQIFIGLASGLSHLSVERMLFAVSVVFALVTSSATFAIARLLGLGRAFAAFAAVVVAINPWWQVVRDHDSFAQLHFVALATLVVATRVVSARRDGERPRERILSAAFVGIALAALVAAYPELAPFALLCVAADITVGALVVGRKNFKLPNVIARLALEGAICFGAAAGALVVTGQAAYVADFLAHQVNTYTTIFAPTGSLDGVPEPDTSLKSAWWAPLAGTWWLGASGAFVAAASLIALLGLAVLKRSAFLRPERAGMLAWAFVVGAATGYFWAFRGDGYAVLKLHGSIFWLYAILAMAIIAWPISSSESGNAPPAPRSLLVLCGVLGAIALLTPVANLVAAGFYLANEIRQNAPAYVMAGKTHVLDFAGMRRRLNKASPQRLLVYTPGGANWTDAALADLSFASFRPTYQAGYFTGNSPDLLRVPSLEVKAIPDYAIVSDWADYIGPGGFGKLEYATGGLRLYRITTAEIAPFRSRAAPDSFGYNWFALAPSGIVRVGPPTRLMLKDRYAFAVFNPALVKAGDRMIAQADIRGERGRKVLLTLTRHCGADEDFVRSEHELSGQYQHVEMDLKFKHDHSCVSFTIALSNSNTPLDVDVENLRLSRKP